VADYVLRKPPASEREAIERSIEESLKHLDLMLGGAMQQAVMKLHAKPERPKPPRPATPPTQGDAT
jgi:PTH1 family peptidyl-tRNA hydrolase